MAKPLVFDFQGTEIAFDMAKIDRAKLYGYKDVEVLDEQGRKCELATLGEDGRTVVGKGGTAIGYLSADGLWCDKNELQPVDLEGLPITLHEKVTIDEYLSHNIRSLYRMDSEQAADDLLRDLKAGSIYKFPYSFRGGLESDVGFLLMNKEEIVFFAVGVPTNIQFVGLQQIAAVVDEDTLEEGEEADLMDFDMI